MLRLLEDPLGDTDLADIVQKRADFDRVELGSLVPEPSRERDRHRRDALGVVAGVVVLRLDAAGECGDRGQVRPTDLLNELRALDRGRELRDDRLSDPTPSRLVEPAVVDEAQGADLLAAGDEGDAAGADPD